MHVAVLCHPRSLLTGLTIPLEMLRAADEFRQVRERVGAELRVTLATPDATPFQALQSFDVAPSCSTRDVDRADLVIVPPFWRKPQVREPQTLDALRRLHQRGAMICAVTTGSFPVAEAELLDGGVATTHWQFFERFARRYGNVDLKRDHLITGWNGIYCAGSLNATADLCAFFAERWFGEEVARLVESQFSPEIRQPAKQQGFFVGEANRQPDELMAVAQDWLQERCCRDVSMGELAAAVGLSQRTLNRRFRAASGRTPGRYLQELRIAEAQSFLRNSNLSVAEVAARVGYGNAAHFTTLYRRHTGTTPTAYRRRVRAKLFGAAGGLSASASSE